ncbi:MAG TPA: metalloregulator ArsR/SmtB family transcription factor, partial [Thermomicrobiales bacterium]|nr:metalloregulator ArsR/SmtB family transcription factor [Thermomicrobiales bacterium]
MNERRSRPLPVIQPDACVSNPVDPPPMAEETRVTLLATFKALSDATRFEVFRFIAGQDAPICACDIVDRFDVSQPTIAHHLKVLRQAGLITATKSGVWVYYALDPR